MSGTQTSTKLSRNLELTQSDAAWITDHISQNGGELLHIPILRREIAKRRLERIDPASIETHPSATADIHPNTIAKNLANLRTHQAFDRPVILVYPLLGIEYVLNTAASLKLLTIGPRSEAEIFALLAAGFAPENITGLDLISYSDFVEVGDMHDMPFEDDSFDVIIVGWVLTYSANNRKAAAEILRVARPGAHIAVGCAVLATDDPPPEEAENAVGGIPADGVPMRLSRFYNSGQILRLFDGHIDAIPFRQDVHPSMVGEVGNVTTIVRLK